MEFYKRVCYYLNNPASIKLQLLRVGLLLKILRLRNSREISCHHVWNFEGNDLASLFRVHGSDKASIAHNYSSEYQEVLSEIRNEKFLICEIGIGTNNPNLPSSMGQAGIPGASLRAFRDYCKQAVVFGADIDEEILINEDRIYSYYVNQNFPKSFEQLKSSIEKCDFPLRFVVIDGLHEFQADANSLLELISLIDQGHFFIEDIKTDSATQFFWKLIVLVIKRHGYRAQLFYRGHNSCLLRICI